LFGRCRFLLGAGLGAAGVLVGRLALPGFLRPDPPRELTDEQNDFVDGCLDGVDRAAIWDVHAHLLGLGKGTDCFVSERMRSHVHPIQRFQFDVYLASAGFTPETEDRDYLDRVAELQKLGNAPGRVMLMAFDMVVDEEGVEQPDQSSFHTPNDYALEAATLHPEVEAIASIHPYRRDAPGRLRAAVALGARAVKWLPGAMHIDPASALCEPFYSVMAELDIPLITHAGAEAAVESAVEHYGDPRRLLSPLEQGVRVVVAHCASLGEADGESAFSRFLTLMDDPAWEGQLFGELSAMTQVNRCGEPLRAIIERSDLHPRLLNGSDYPLPAVDPLVSTLRLRQMGYITGEERRLCNGVYRRNPLLFDLVVKRCLRVDGVGLGASAFETRRHFL
jgi:uncharacterized protein